MPQWLPSTSTHSAAGSRQARQSTIASVREYTATAGAPSRSGRREQSAELRAAVAVPALVREQPPDPDVAEKRHRPHRAQHRRRHRELVEHGRAERHHRSDPVGIPRRQRAGERAAAALADDDRGLLERFEDKPEPVELATGAADVQPDPAVVHLVAAAAEPPGEHGQRGVAGQEPRDQQDRLPAVALLRRGGGGAGGGPKKSVGEQPSELGPEPQFVPERRAHAWSSPSCRMSFPVFSPRNSIRNTSGNLSSPPGTTSSREWSSPRRSHSASWATPSG